MSYDFVAMEHAQCPVCGVIHTHNTGVLLDRRLKALPQNPEELVTHRGLCEEHSKQVSDGYVLCIVCTTEEDPNNSRTGDLLAIRDGIFFEIFGVEKPTKSICFIPLDVFESLKKFIVDN